MAEQQPPTTPGQPPTAPGPPDQPLPPPVAPPVAPPAQAPPAAPPGGVAPDTTQQYGADMGAPTEAPADLKKNKKVVRILAAVLFIAGALAIIFSFLTLTGILTNHEGIVTFTFDNGFATQYTAGLPVLEGQNVKATFFIITGYINSGGNYMSAAQVHDLYSKGHEIGSHTKSHRNLPTLTPDQLTFELSASKDWIERIEGNIGGPVHSFASPNGLDNDAVIAAIKRYYRSNRTATDGYNTVFGFDKYKLKIKFVKYTTTNEEVAGWIKAAVDNKAWLILVYHKISDDYKPDCCRADSLNAHIISAKASGLPILTIDEAVSKYERDKLSIGTFQTLAWILIPLGLVLMTLAYFVIRRYARRVEVEQ